MAAGTIRFRKAQRAFAGRLALGQDVDSDS